MANQITVTLKRSNIGVTPSQQKNLIGLGLTRRGKNVLIDDTSSNRGMIRKVIHLVQVQKGNQIPETKITKKQFEVIVGEHTESKTKSKKKMATSEKTVAKKTVKKTAKK